MKSSEVYLMAAKWLAKNPGNILAYACMKVAPDESHGDRLQHLREWLGGEYVDSGESEYSVLALLFMHQIALDEEET